MASLRADALHAQENPVIVDSKSPARWQPHDCVALHSAVFPNSTTRSIGRATKALLPCAIRWIPVSPSSAHRCEHENVFETEPVAKRETKEALFAAESNQENCG